MYTCYSFIEESSKKQQQQQRVNILNNLFRGFHVEIQILLHANRELLPFDILTTHTQTWYSPSFDLKCVLSCLSIISSHQFQFELWMNGIEFIRLCQRWCLRSLINHSIFHDIACNNKIFMVWNNRTHCNWIIRKNDV